MKSKHQMTDEEYSAWLKYMTTQCYGCATQRHKCEHDGIDWEEYFGERDWSDDSIPNDWEIEGESNEK